MILHYNKTLINLNSDIIIPSIVGPTGAQQWLSFTVTSLTSLETWQSYRPPLWDFKSQVLAIRRNPIERYRPWLMMMSYTGREGCLSLVSLSCASLSCLQQRTQCLPLHCDKRSTS